jgi:hypothetical protein
MPEQPVIMLVMEEGMSSESLLLTSFGSSGRKREKIVTTPVGLDSIPYKSVTYHHISILVR